MTQTPSPSSAPTDAADLVRRYLAAMEARDLDAARDLLGDDFVMNFPGASGMRTLEALIAWSTPRYRFVKKIYEAVEAFAAEPGAVVYVRGSLYGEWPDGGPFSGVRFVDRFELKDGAIVRQDVWNDLGEASRRQRAETEERKRA